MWYKLYTITLNWLITRLFYKTKRSKIEHKEHISITEDTNDIYSNNNINKIKKKDKLVINSAHICNHFNLFISSAG